MAPPTAKVLFDSASKTFIRNLWHDESGNLQWNETNSQEDAVKFCGDTPTLDKGSFEILNKDQWKIDPSKNRFYFVNYMPNEGA